MREEIYELKKLRLLDQEEITRLKHMISRFNLQKSDAYKNEDNNYFTKIRNFVFRGGKTIGEKDIEQYHLENLQLRDTINKLKVENEKKA